MEQINELLGAALTAIREPSTNPLPLSTARIKWEFETEGDPQLSAMLDACQAFADEIKSGMPPRWLTLTGPSGIGKTHLAKRLYRWFDNFGCMYTEPTTGARLGHSGRRVSWRDAATLIREGDWGFVSDLCERWFVVLDDIGAEHQGGTGIVQSTLERILDSRINKWTLITSNLSHRKIAETIDARVASRLIRGGGVIVESLKVTDYNVRKRAA